MYLDTDVIYALIRKNDRHKTFAENILATKDRFYTSALTMIELELITKRELGNSLSQNILEIVHSKIQDLEIVHLTEEIIRNSLQLRKKYDLGIFDSVHATTALTRDKKMASTDRIFRRIKELKIIR